MSERFNARTRLAPARVEGHPERLDLALYVIDALGPDRKDAVESHVLACPACADELAREAQLESALEQVAQLAAVRVVAAAEAAELAARRTVRAIPRAIPAVEAHVRVHLVAGGRRSRWAGGVGGALAAAAALVLAFASSTARSDTGGGMAQRAPALHDAAGDMSGAFGTGMEPVASVSGVAGDALDGG